MTKKQYEKRMKQHEASFDKLWQKIVLDTNEFVFDNKDCNLHSLSGMKVERFTDKLALSCAWVQDRINDIRHTQKKSLTYKMRKLLGYNG